MSILAQYHIGREEIFLFIVKKEFTQPRVFKTEIGSLYEELTACFENLMVKENATELDTINSLIQPLIDESEENETIWIVPNKILQYLPFHALPIGSSFLGLRNPICYTPSSSTMAFCRKGPRFTGKKILALGDPTDDLKYARLEASTVVGTFGGDNLLGREANASNLFSLLGDRAPYDIVHFACHGYANEESEHDSGVVLASDHAVAADHNRELLTATDILRRKINSSLVTVSACDAGLIDLRSSDEVFGMTRSLLYSGASSVLLSSWPVDDFSTYLFIKEFYRSLYDMAIAGKGNKAEAVQIASKFIFNITLKEIIKLCDAEAERCIREGNTLKRIEFMIDSAQYCLQANDLSESLNRFQEIHSEIKQIPSDLANLASKLQEQVEEIEFRQLLKRESVDYEQTPFCIPWYWATFSLFGDWTF